MTKSDKVPNYVLSMYKEIATSIKARKKNVVMCERDDSFKNKFTRYF